jgi:putative endonuclease
VDQGYYIGYTKDLKNRLLEHNNFKTKSLQHRLPMKIIYFEAYLNKHLAIKREYELKHNSFRRKELLDRFKN